MLQYAHDRIRSVISTTVFLFTDSFFGLLQNAKSSTRRPCDRAQQCPEAWSRIPVTIPNNQLYSTIPNGVAVWAVDADQSTVVVVVHVVMDPTRLLLWLQCVCATKMSSHCCSSVFVVW